jgi:carbon storage regulator CsrA
MIGSEIELTILEVRGNRIQVGIAAPREVSIRRVELLERPGEDRKDIPGPHDRARQMLVAP